MLLRSTDGDLFLWCPVDRDPQTGAPIRQLIPVEPVTEDAGSLRRRATDGKEDGELADLRRQVGELARQVVALRDELALSDATNGRRATGIHGEPDESVEPHRAVTSLPTAPQKTRPDFFRR